MTGRMPTAKQVLVVGMHKTGTTIVSSVIQRSIPDGRFFIEPRSVGFFEKLGKHDAPGVVKLIYEHWSRKPLLLSGVVRGETRFHPDAAVAIVRDPRDGLISGLMYRAYECVLHGATRDQVDRWVHIVREKEAIPEKHSIVGLVRVFNEIFAINDTPESHFETFARYCGWIDGNRDYLHVLKYEDFIAGDTAALSAYLGLPLSPSRDVDPSLSRVARTRQSGGWRRMMLPEDVAYFSDRFASVLERHGYADWDVRPDKSPPASGSEYIARIAEEAFESRRSTAHPGPQTSSADGDGLRVIPRTLQRP
jgi:hypothetical protein